MAGSLRTTSLLRVLAGAIGALVVIAAIVFLVIPTEWIGAKVEVIIRQ